MQFKNYLFIFFGILFFTSCVNNTAKSDEPKTPEAIQQKKEIDAIAKKNQSSNMVSELSGVMNMIVDAYAEGKMDDQIKTTPSGLKYFVNHQGRGLFAGPGDMCSVHYIGVTPDGQKFDSSFDRMTPFNFRIGLNEVIKGWEEGLQLMKTGGNFVFFVPPHLAYGEQGVPGTVNGNQELIFLIILNGFYR